MRTRANIIIGGALLVALAGVAAAMPADWHGGRHPQPVTDSGLVRTTESLPAEHVMSGGDGPWRGIVAVSGIVGRAMKATFECRADGTGGAGGMMRDMAACVLRTGLLTVRGTPLPRAAAGVAAETLLGLGRGDGEAACSEGGR